MDIYFRFSSEDNVELTVSVNLTSSLSSQTQLAASSSILTSSNELPTVSACSTCSKISVSHEDISSPATTLPSLSSTMQPLPNTGKSVISFACWSSISLFNVIPNSYQLQILCGFFRVPKNPHMR